MKKLLLDVSYTTQKKYWADSQVKNMVVDMQEGESIHNTIARVLKNCDYAVMNKECRHVSKMYIDTKAGDTKHVGYIYNVKIDIQNDQTYKWVKIPFQAWVRVRKVEEIF